MSDYSASRPAKVKVELMHFLKCDGKDLIVLAVALVAGALLLPLSWKPALIVAGIGLFVFLVSIFQTPSVFAEGDTCPAIVVDTERRLIAVLTDLAKAGSPMPVVKIMKQPLGRVTSGPFKKGTRLAFVAMYSGQPAARSWSNFGGYLVNAGTTSAKVIQRVVQSIPDEDWDALVTALRQLEQPFQPGLYDVAEPRRRSNQDSEWDTGSAPKRRRSATRVHPVLLGVAVLVALPVAFLVASAVRAKMQGAANDPFAANGPAAVVPQPDASAFPRDMAQAVPPGLPNRNPFPGQAPGSFPPAAGFQPGQPPAGLDPSTPVPSPATPAESGGVNAGTALADPAVTELPAGQNTSPTSSSSPVVVNGDWQPGEKIEAEWAGRWLPAVVKRVVDPGRVEIHWEGYGDNSDEVLPVARLRRTPNVIPVTAETKLAPGMKAEAEWAKRWLPVEILEVRPDGTVKIHWVGYSQGFDEAVPRTRLRLTTPPAAPK